MFEPSLSIPTPYYVVDESLLEENLKILNNISQKTGCKILLAQKAFSMYYFYPFIGQYLQGTTASGLFEARLGYEHMGGETHIYAPAYKQDEIEEIASICNHIVFNSFAQWEKYKTVVMPYNREYGIRLNPGFSTQDAAIYDPCAPYSRLGVTRKNFMPHLLDGITGFHFHTLCEQDALPLEQTLLAVEEQFGQYFNHIQWINFGGGHHITKKGYQIEILEKCIDRIQNRYNLQVYLEPGEAVALNAGYLVSTVLEIVENEMNIAILDTSAACHMPDVLEMPYRPFILNSGSADEKAYVYRLGGPTCLAGDIIGDYSFDAPLKPGDKLVFTDMAHYSMVKNNTFNGINLPSIAAIDKNGAWHTIKTFGYNDFKSRLS